MLDFIIENVKRKADSGRVAGLLALLSAYTEQCWLIMDGQATKGQREDVDAMLRRHEDLLILKTVWFRLGVKT